MGRPKQIKAVRTGTSRREFFKRYRRVGARRGVVSRSCCRFRPALPTRCSSTVSPAVILCPTA